MLELVVKQNQAQKADPVSLKRSSEKQTPEPRLQRACACGGSCVRCQGEHGDQGHTRVKHGRAGNVGDAGVPPVVHEVLRSAGQPLDASARTFMESRFGHDFSRVRVHTDSKAAEAAQSVNALAFTVGQNIAFAGNNYSPQSPSGRELLAHELAHTIQQRSSAATPLQAKLRLGAANEPTEAAADRAAAAVMRGGVVPALPSVSAGVVQRQQQRTCTRGEASGDHAAVNCSDGAEYDVQTLIVRGRVPATQTGVTGGLEDQSTIYLRVRVCRGRDEVQIYTGVDVAQPLQQLIENVLRGSPGVSGVRLEPEMRVTWNRSDSFRIEAYGGPTVVGGAPRVGGRGGLRGQIGPVTGGIEIGSDPTLTGPGGSPEIHGTGQVGVATDRAPHVDCRDEDKTVSYRCTPITHTRPVEPILPDDVQAYVFFEYATANVIAPTPRILRGNQELSDTLASLTSQGYRAQSVDAHTSPEGPRGGPRQPGGFVGNDTLSDQRRVAALTWLRANCPTCIDTEPTSTAESELYSGYRRPGVELEGDPLTRRARQGFLGQDAAGQEVAPADPLRRPEHDRLATRPPARQRAELYPLMRRAVIHLHREGRAGVPSRPERGETGNCPADVIAAMQRRT